MSTERNNKAIAVVRIHIENVIETYEGPYGNIIRVGWVFCKGTKGTYYPATR